MDRFHELMQELGPEYSDRINSLRDKIERNPEAVLRGRYLRVEKRKKAHPQRGGGRPDNPGGGRPDNPGGGGRPG